MQTEPKDRAYKVAVTLDREELAKLRALAAKLRRSLADTLREAVDRELGRQP
jgi:hypothetical protein